MNIIKTIWKFSRPHTIIGTIVSITTLYFIADKSNQQYHFLQSITYLTTLLSCLCCNLYITGINQIYDIELDKINKPNLPLVTGELSKTSAKKIVLLALLGSLYFSFIQNYYFGGLIALIAIIGSAYSIPPIRLKKYHFWAATCIALVRGPLVNLGVYFHFYFTKHSFPIQINSEIILLTLVITAFSVGIAWFKDIPDADGDSQFKINTLTVKLSKNHALKYGLALVSFAYLLTILVAFFPKLFIINLSPDPITIPNQKIIFGAFQIINWGTLILLGLRLDVNNQIQVKKFYMIYWGLFFLEYFSFAILW